MLSMYISTPKLKTRSVIFVCAKHLLVPLHRTLKLSATRQLASALLPHRMKRCALRSVTKKRTYTMYRKNSKYVVGSNSYTLRRLYAWCGRMEASIWRGYGLRTVFVVSQPTPTLCLVIMYSTLPCRMTSDLSLSSTLHTHSTRTRKTSGDIQVVWITSGTITVKTVHSHLRRMHTSLRSYARKSLTSFTLNT